MSDDIENWFDSLRDSWARGALEYGYQTSPDFRLLCHSAYRQSVILALGPKSDRKLIYEWYHDKRVLLIGQGIPRSQASMVGHVAEAFYFRVIPAPSVPLGRQVRKYTGRLINLAIWEGLTLLYKEGVTDGDEQKEYRRLAKVGWLFEDLYYLKDKDIMALRGEGNGTGGTADWTGRRAA